MKSGEAEDGRDSRVVGAYRAAAEALDERPSPAARAAILAAAARAADAQPRDAVTGAPARRAAAPKGASAMSKRPLVLVASVLVATVAIVLSTNVERELPEKPAPAAGGAGPRNETNDKPAALRAKADIETNEAKRAGEGKPEGAAIALAERKAQGAPAAADRARAPAASDTARRADVPRATPAPMADATSAAPEARVPPAPTAQRAAPGRPARDSASKEDAASRDALIAKSAEEPKPSAGATVQERAYGSAAPPPAAASPQSAPEAPAASRDKFLAEGAERAAKEETVRAKSALRQAPGPQDARTRGTAQAPVLRASEPAASTQLARARPADRAPILDLEVMNDPARWLKRIVALRDAGLDEQADRELAAWRERYPLAEVPSNALPRSGTR